MAIDRSYLTQHPMDADVKIILQRLADDAIVAAAQVATDAATAAALVVANAATAAATVAQTAAATALALSQGALGDVSGTTAPPATSLNGSYGDVWSLGAPTTYGFQVLLNGTNVASGQGTVISWKRGQIKVKNNLNNWYLWTDPSYSPTTAP